MMAPIAAFWCRSPSRANFGDALTPWLIRRITGQPPVFAAPHDPRPKVLVTGSIVALAESRCTVWGSGVMTRNDRVRPNVTLLAVRGPLTRERAMACGVECPPTYGDPALLMPRFLQPAAGRRRDIGFAPHFSDLPRVTAAWRNGDRARLIDVQQPIEKVVAAVTSCELVISSSLHALILSHAYGIPAVRVSLGRLPSGDDTKFVDYQLSVGLEPQPAIRVGACDLDLEGLSRWAQLPDRIDVDALWAACPFRKPT